MKQKNRSFRHLLGQNQPPGYVGLKLAVPLTLTALFFSVPVAQSLVVKQSAGNGNTPSNNRPQSCADVQAARQCHEIEMTARALSNGLLAYQMLAHAIVDGTEERQDVTTRYSLEPSIPGPTIVIAEGDEVFLTIYNDIQERDAEGGTVATNEQVSVHVHGVHYDIDSDGTLALVNHVSDQGAIPGESYTYHWQAAPGTAGTWPYHDHNFGDINGAEHKGLFGAVIVNPASRQVTATVNDRVQRMPISSITKDYVLYLGDDAFWGMEIDYPSQQQTALWVNPTLVASPGGLVRFHLIALGTDFHEFMLTDYNWFDPLTNDLITQKAIGPLEHHVFTLRPRESTQYVNNAFSKYLLGMKGEFEVLPGGGPSISSPAPELL